MRSKQIFQIALLLVIAFLTPSVHAVCSIVSVSNGSFGTVTTQNNILNQHLADITVSCDSDYLLGIDAGSHPASSRQLDQSGNSIPYTLFQGATMSEWGSQGLASANTYPMPALGGSGINITHSIYASAFTKDKVPQGTYNDTVSIILANSTGTPLSTTTLAFNLNLVAFCTLDTSSFGSFGNYPIGNTAITNIALGSIAVTCPNSIAYKIGIDKGQNLSAGRRRMTLNGTQFIPYTLKYNASEWGDMGLTALAPGYVESFSAPAITGTGTGIAQNFMIYGDAWIENATAVGTYTDTLIVTLAW